MRWLMLCREPRLYSCQRLKEACETHGIALDILDPNRMLLKLAEMAGKSHTSLFYQTGEPYDKARPAPFLLPDYDAVLPRFGTASTAMGCNVLRHFEAKKVAVLNASSAFELARSKWQSLQQLAARGVPVPVSSFAGELVSASEAVAQHETPVVIKTLTGSQGVGVMLGEHRSSCQSLLDTLRHAKVPALLQNFVAESKGQDIRAFVIGDEVVAAMQRMGSANDFRANLHQGGNAETIALTPEEQQLAVRAAKAIGLDVAGVDLIRTNSGLRVLEVNASPGLEGIEKASGQDIAGKIVTFLLKKISPPILPSNNPATL